MSRTYEELSISIKRAEVKKHTLLKWKKTGYMVRGTLPVNEMIETKGRINIIAIKKRKN